jgi:DNA modification methylase
LPRKTPIKPGKSESPLLAMADRIEMWPITRLLPYDRNPRTHTEEQISQIAASIVEFGFTNPILVDSEAGILAGHGRLRAAKRLGLAHVPVIPLDHLTEAQRRAYIIADNKLAENAGWDLTLLQSEIADLQSMDFDLNLLGFTEAELNEIRDDFEQPEEGATDQDDAPPVPGTADQVVSRTGDVWMMGPHRLVVGDMRDPEARLKALNGRRAALIVTDPPYNVDYTGNTEEQLKIEGDIKTREDYKQFLVEMAHSMAAMIEKTASLYIFYPSWFHIDVESALLEADIVVRSMLVWGKNHFRLNWGRYKFAHEPILYCHMKGESDAWYGDHAQQTLWMEKKPSASRQHPTMKPVELIERAIVNSSQRGELVVDPFGGSGSTLIACQRMSRTCSMFEIDPFYADVILKRWMAYTKQLAKLDGERKFTEMERERYQPVAVG